MKVTIDGQVYEWDGRKAPTEEALWIEDVYKKNYGQWQIDLSQGSARAFILLACLIWRREGRNVDTAYQDVLDGKIGFDINELVRTASESVEAEEKAQAEADPTTPGASPDPAGSPTTGTGTSGSSPSGSGSARGKSGSSKSRTSRP